MEMILKNLREIDYFKNGDLAGIAFVDGGYVVRAGRVYCGDFGAWIDLDFTKDLSQSEERIYRVLQGFVDEKFGSNSKSIYNKVGAL